MLRAFPPVLVSFIRQSITDASPPPKFYRAPFRNVSMQIIDAVAGSGRCLPWTALEQRHWQL